MSAFFVKFRHPLGTFTLDINTDIEDTGLTAVFGPSGCGKTTLLRCIAGLERAETARFTAFGTVWHDSDKGVFVPPHQRPFGMVFQNANLFEHTTVRKNCLYGLKRTPAGDRHFPFERIVQFMKIDRFLDRPVRCLSGGQRQRVAMARALLAGPQLLMMDEPLSALDSQSKFEILPFLEHIRDELHVPILYVSHSYEEVSRLADRIIVLDNGGISSSGPLNEVVTQLSTAARVRHHAAATVQAEVDGVDKKYNLVRVRFDTGVLWMEQPVVELKGLVRIRIAADDVILTTEDQLENSCQNSIAVLVEEIVEDGPAMCLVRLRAGPTPLLSRITRRAIDRLAIEPGMNCSAQVKAASLA